MRKLLSLFRMTFPLRCIYRAALSIGAVLTATGTVQADLKEEIGYTALVSELGASTPTGAGVSATHCEAFIDGINYRPDVNAAEFSEKSFVAKSAASGASSHATAVALNLYGSNSIAPALGSGASGGTVNLYSASGWIYTDFLRTGEVVSPNVETQDVANFSWIGSGGTEVTRRLDFAIERDDFVVVVGLNNGAESSVPELLANAYNAISVGQTNGSHSSGQTVSDGPGRIKPEIVVPLQGFTSFATPVVGAAAAVLIQKARSNTALNSGAKAQVVKALLLTGATKTEFPGWSHTATQPLDAHAGAGELNIQNSYRILVAGQQIASGSVISTSTGWDFAPSSVNARRYFFDIPAGKKALAFSSILTWNRTFSANNHNLPSVANLALGLSQATGTTVGASVEASNSAVDNVEHIYQTGLPSGRYVLEVTRPSGGNVSYGLAWQASLIDLPTVTVSATTPTASEGGAQPGQFTITRTSTVELSQPLTVKYSISGSAQNGIDYQPLSATVTIPANILSVVLSVEPLIDQIVEGTETATLTLSTDAAYVLGSAVTASVQIADAPFQAWITQNFPQSSWNDASITGETADPDADGQPNLAEFFFGTLPLDPAARYQPTASYDGDRLDFTYRRADAASNVLATPEVSTDLIVWDPSGAQIASEESLTAEGFTTITLTLQPAPEGRQFIRLQLER